MSDTHIPTALRKRVSEQARFRCGYCLTQEKIIGAPMDLDHIIPEAGGGQTIEDNLWLACSLCNNIKGSRVSGLDPFTGERVRLFDPRHQIWQDHFEWSTAQDLILGLTAIGRATVVALELNRPLLVSARQSWTRVGFHPPQD